MYISFWALSTETWSTSFIRVLFCCLGSQLTVTANDLDKCVPTTTQIESLQWESLRSSQPWQPWACMDTRSHCSKISQEILPEFVCSHIKQNFMGKRVSRFSVSLSKSKETLPKVIAHPLPMANPWMKLGLYT